MPPVIKRRALDEVLDDGGGQPALVGVVVLVGFIGSEIRAGEGTRTLDS